MKVFMEYKIDPDHVQAYQQIFPKVKAWMLTERIQNYQHFTAVDQPLLFVEMFDVADREEYNHIKRMRCEQNPFFADCVVGGKERIQMWLFAETENDI